MDGFPEAEMRLLEDKWEELIMKQAQISKNNELIFAKESSHSIHIDRPDIIITAIDNLIQNTFKKSRHSSRLSNGKLFYLWYDTYRYYYEGEKACC